jgi:hypothetical protein
MCSKIVKYENETIIFEETGKREREERRLINSYTNVEI